MQLHGQEQDPMSATDLLNRVAGEIGFERPRIGDVDKAALRSLSDSLAEITPERVDGLRSLVRTQAARCRMPCDRCNELRSLLAALSAIAGFAEPERERLVQSRDEAIAYEQSENAALRAENETERVYSQGLSEERNRIIEALGPYQPAWQYDDDLAGAVAALRENTLTQEQLTEADVTLCIAVNEQFPVSHPWAKRFRDLASRISQHIELQGEK